MPKIAIVAALEREVHPLVRHWSRTDRKHENHDFRFFESGNAVLVCGGIGFEAARRVAEAAVTLYQPEILISAGFAGALGAKLKVGEILWPRTVIDANDGSRTEIASGQGSLVSFSAVAGVEQKRKLAAAYDAAAVDMEAAAVARVADIRGLRFAAVKVISDDAEFDMPQMSRFVSSDGRFRSGAFTVFAMLRPWLWSSVMRLGKNSRVASQSLCREIERYLRTGVRMAELEMAPGV